MILERDTRSRPRSRRRGLLGLVTAVSAVLVTGLTGPPAQAVGFTRINVWNSTHCLDNATQNAAKLQMWSCGSGSEQKWLEGFNTQTALFTFTNQRTGRCITAPAWGPGTVTVQFCNAADPTQQWRVFAADNPNGPPSGWYDVWQNASSGYCLSTPSVGNGTLVQTTVCDPSDQYDRWHTQ
ncbi:RICIN domain-containing protein [Streptomyces sp. ERV7]|uniref:RICIN domain-containing protein n=1 Tax=Streptomyces sp. ERV7 TaxID=1322334 RepID=UPI000A67DA1E|nr:ricin-type beta-trefoil lectin domain protein [Streptomyces sp. ERV7]